MPKRGSLLNSAFVTYKIEDEIGGGGSGVVCRVTDEQGGVFAAKILRSGFSRQKLKRFQNELVFCFKQDHQNIVKVLDQGLSEVNEPFYLMPLATSTLRSKLKQGIPSAEVLPLFAKILDGVEAAHLRGITHRDLKPENILLGSPQQELVIADFGIAQFEEDDLHTFVETSSQERLANWVYSAPEQRSPGTLVDKRADIFALGLILAEMFTGEVPHGVGAAEVATKHASFGYLDALIEKMRQQSPERRPQSINEIKRELVGRHNDFVEFQRLSELKKIVVKESEIDDPLIATPPTLENVEFTGSALNFTLSTNVNRQWINRFHNLGSYSSVMGHGPEGFVFSRNVATVAAQQYFAQDLINHFKNYLKQTNDMYKTDVIASRRKETDTERARIANAIAAEEARKRVQSELKW